ncbi:MAG: chromosome segregation protein SMC [Planctomycetota bacterium]
MYLKRISLSGFKSFADPVDFDFDPGTSAVVGPNGCGKSNIVDAFRWVLGERSAKGLRGSEMLDVIFKGTQKRAALSRAEVRLLFDNEDQSLPIESSEVEIARILLRDGTSEYQVNRRRCRLKDILAIFADTGIGADGYSVLGQGKVDSFLNANSQERRKIFEEAAGISSFRRQRSEALNRLDRSERELTRVNDQLSEIERRIRSLKMQAGRARRYIEDRDRFREVSAVLAAQEVDQLCEERERLSFRLQWRNTLREMLSDLTGILEAELDEFRTRLEGTHRIMEETRQSETKKRVALDGIGTRRSQLEDQRRHSISRNKDREKQLEDLIRVENEYCVRCQEIRTRVKKGISELRGVRKELAQQVEEYRILFEERERLDSSIREAKDKELGLVFDETRLRNSIAAFGGDLRGQDTIRERRLAEDLDFGAQEKDLESVISHHDEVILSAVESNQSTTSLAESYQQEVDQRTSILDESRKRLAALRADRESREGRLRFLVELEESLEGLGKGTQKLINSEAPAAGDIRGLLARLIEVDSDTARMVDAVLGRVLETIVLQGRTPIEDRIRAVENILDGETAMFVSIEDDVAREESAPDLPPGVETLSSRVDCDWICRPVVDALLGEVLIAQDLTEALQLRQRFQQYRVVLHDGTVIEPWGAVRIPASSRVGLVSRRVEMNRLRTSMEEIRSHLTQVSEQGDSLEESISARRGEIQRLEQEAGRARIEAEHARRERERAREALKRISERRKTLRGDIDQAQLLYQELSAQRDSTSIELEQVSSERELLKKQLEEYETKFSALEENLSAMDSSLQKQKLLATREQERISSDWREQRRLSEEIEQRQQLRVRVAEEISDENDRGATCTQQLIELEQEEKTLGEDLGEIARRRAELDLQLERHRQERNLSEKGLKKCRGQAESIREGRESDLLAEKECSVRIEGIRERIQEDLEMSLDDLPLEEWRANLLEDDEDLGKFARRLRKEYQEIQSRMRRNSNVNLEAVEELEAEEVRHSEIAGEVSDLIQSRDLIMEAIETLDAQSRTLFTESFAAVRKNFQEIFALMFGGGTAGLKLEDDMDPLEAGIDVIARPPGKRISSLRLLSGGERSLTAISVIFALFKARPSPFCILDEVDAALDEQNTRRFVRVLQEFSKSSQFLVITHSRISMAEAERLYGVTMEEQGVSRRVVVQVEDAGQWAGTESKSASDRKPTSGNDARPLFADTDPVGRGTLADGDETSPEPTDSGLQQA